MGPPARTMTGPPLFIDSPTAANHTTASERMKADESGQKPGRLSEYTADLIRTRDTLDECTAMNRGHRRALLSGLLTGVAAQPVSG